MGIAQTEEMNFMINIRWDGSTPSPCRTLSYSIGQEKRSVTFDGVAELLFQLERICDLQGHPRRDTRLRSIPGYKLTSAERSEYVPISAGCIREHTFLISITGRLQSSFQGYMTAFNKKIYFCSELRLIHLVYEMMERSKNASFPMREDIV